MRNECATVWHACRFGRMAIAMAAMACLPAQAVTTHHMPLAELTYSASFITPEGVLVFPGKTLADLEGCSFWGRIGGSALGRVKGALSNAVQAFPAGATGTAIERYDFDLVSNEGQHLKGVHIQLYNGDDGVYAKAVKSWYVQAGTGALPTIRYTVDAVTGELTWNGVTNSGIATGPSVNGYGIGVFGVARPLTATATLAFPGLKVADIAKNAPAKMSVRISGTSIGEALGQSATVTNVVVTAGTEASPTAIRCEAQFINGTYTKCGAFELTDGDGGVYVRYIGGYYKNDLTYFGKPFLNPDGTLVSGVASMNSTPSTLFANGYGLYNLEVNEEARVECDTSYVFDMDTYLTGTAQLVFPGATLAELEGCTFYGIMDGSSVGHGSMVRPSAYTHIVKRYPENTEETLQKLFLQMTHWDGTYTKSVVVELTEGNGGVYGRAILSSYVKANRATQQSFGIKEDGSGVTNYVGYTGNNVSTADHARDYGIKMLGATKLVSGSARLAFPGLTVADIFRGEMLAKTCGASMSNSDQFYDHTACNRVITSTDAETGAITGFRDEMQCSMGYIKCVELRFTNGEGGVYVQPVRACYAGSPYATVGRMMIANNDTGVAGGVANGSVATSFWTSGYGVCCLAAALPDDASTGPATAVWNGGDPANAASWTCKAGDGTLLADTLPDKHTQVLIAANVSMTADADLTPYASVMTTAASFTIDTAGHKLYLKSLHPWHATTITDTVGGGELHMVAPDGRLTYNNQIALSGSLKLVTEGEGLFVAAKTEQTYTGGTQVALGTFMYDAAPAQWPLGGNGTANATAQVVTVDGGARLDVNGKTGFGYTTVIFNGGTVYGSTTQFNCAKRLTADSYLTTNGDFKMQASARDLGGDWLSVDILPGKSLYQECPITGPGTIDVTRGGWLVMTSTDIAAANVDFKIHCALNINKAISIHDYYSWYDNEANTWGTTAALKVYGTFTPASEFFTAATMMNGSVIDLSAKTEVWSTTSSSNGGNTLSYEQGGTIYVDLGEREMDFSTTDAVKIVSWDAQPVNVKFMATDRKSYHVVQKADGLYCLNAIGTTIYVR